MNDGDQIVNYEALHSVIHDPEKLNNFDDIDAVPFDEIIEFDPMNLSNDDQIDNNEAVHSEINDPETFHDFDQIINVRSSTPGFDEVIEYDPINSDIGDGIVNYEASSPDLETMLDCADEIIKRATESLAEIGCSSESLIKPTTSKQYSEAIIPTERNKTAFCGHATEYDNEASVGFYEQFSETETSLDGTMDTDQQGSPNSTENTETNSDVTMSEASKSKSGKRKAYTATNRLKILSEYVPNQKGSGFYALGKRYQIDPSVIRRWHTKKTKIKENKTRQTLHQSRRLSGGGRKPPFGELESHLLDWVKSRNNDGLQVSYSLIFK